MNIAVDTAIGWFGEILHWSLLIRAFLSWVPQVYDGPIGRVVITFTEPFIVPVRYLINKSPLSGGMANFSLLIAWLLWTRAFMPLIRGLAYTYLPT